MARVSRARLHGYKDYPIVIVFTFRACAGVLLSLPVQPGRGYENSIFENDNAIFENDNVILKFFII